MKAKIYKGDCLDKMKLIPDKSIDLILTDPPYGTTQCHWDAIIDFDLMWKELNRVIKKNGAILLFSAEPFSSALRMSNIKSFKYDWIWEKGKVTGFLNAKKQPMRCIEMINVFYNEQCNYYPQGTKKCYKIAQNSKSGRGISENYGKVKNEEYLQDTTNYPKQLIKFPAPVKAIHPTEKPISLLKYLINTYTKHGETVLDFTMGSASTGEACRLTYRDFIGIEQDDKYFEISKQRLKACGFHDLEIIE